MNLADDVNDLVFLKLLVVNELQEVGVEDGVLLLHQLLLRHLATGLALSHWHLMKDHHLALLETDLLIGF